MNNFKLTQISNTVNGSISLTGSKSISNRVLVIRRLTKNSFSIKNISDSEDTSRLSLLLNMICQCGDSGIPMVIDTGDAGTVSRFLTAFLSFREGIWLVTGSSRMCERPIEGLVNGLIELGADISYTAKKGKMPLRIVGKDIRGGEITIDSSKSSQFITALMLISPYFDNGLKINFERHPVSWPYIEMTRDIMTKFGINVDLNKSFVKILPKKYKSFEYTVEGDWSSAAFWFETLALAESGKIILKNISLDSIQGDKALVDIYKHFGIETKQIRKGIEIVKNGKADDAFEYDFMGCPDLVPPVMATCAALRVPALFKNIAHVSYKESDRISSMSKELAKTGVVLEKKKKGWFLNPHKMPSANELKFSSYNDHRVAMSLAPLVLKYNNVVISAPDVVNKSYRNFWNDFISLKFAALNIISDN